MGKSDCIRPKWLYSGKVVVFGRSGCIRAKEVVKRQKWLFSVKVVVFGQKLLCSGKRGCIQAKVVVFGKSGSIQSNVVVFGENVVFAKSGCIRAK